MSVSVVVDEGAVGEGKLVPAQAELHSAPAISTAHSASWAAAVEAGRAMTPKGCKLLTTFLIHRLLLSISYQ